MLNPFEWKYQDQAALIIATLAGAGFGIAISQRSGNEWLGTLIWTLIGAVIVGGAFYFHRLTARSLPATSPRLGHSWHDVSGEVGVSSRRLIGGAYGSNV